MASAQLKQVLAGIDLFAGLSPAAISQIADTGATFKTAAGGKVISEGAQEAGLRVVLDGSATVDVGGQSRGEIGVGDYVGELSMIDGAPRSATVVAGPGGVTTFALSSAAFMPLVRGDGDIAAALLKTLVARLRKVEAAANNS
ncbi:cyclic nucleotide-binding domain-containing protein [Flexivirga sp. ID2601S]|uniref:Cyclic nucleotide-binding domain-containing protein n=1 Tax=Flexivirga aerilata TaxID=1656889 RepID=A0A849AL94_9MICO|nr:cyclic nucleotide-binding domain-containing protein [Flexivirga aerilata]NNG40068.1 cyclic nucleotide-binding domain-containing protein [Flexivirga aerilata]